MANRDSELTILPGSQLMKKGASTQTQVGAHGLTLDPTLALWGSEKIIWTELHFRSPRFWVRHRESLTEVSHLHGCCNTPAVKQ